ncbi:MAG: PEGA domain-containing protein [Candidatus Omnitrophota bacterium]
MHISDRIKRAVAFYFSVSLFFALAPIVLSYSLGYSIDFHAFKIYKTGIIYIKSQPSGAAIYLNGEEIRDVTPARIEKLKPGTYRIEVRRDGFYPWQKDVTVSPNMVTKADDIVLFPLKQDMKKIGGHGVRDFIISDNKSAIYYMTDAGLVKANIDGSGDKKISLYTEWPSRIRGKRFSPDGQKFFYFTDHVIWIVRLGYKDGVSTGEESATVEKLVETSSSIISVFWYSESNHVVFVTEKDINVVELSGNEAENAVMLYKFYKSPRGLFYDDNNDSLYFTDSEDAWGKPFLHRLDLRQKFFSQLMQRFKKEFDEPDEKR